MTCVDVTRMTYETARPQAHGIHAYCAPAIACVQALGLCVRRVRVGRGSARTKPSACACSFPAQKREHDDATQPAFRQSVVALRYRAEIGSVPGRDGQIYQFGHYNLCVSPTTYTCISLQASIAYLSIVISELGTISFRDISLTVSKVIRS